MVGLSQYWNFELVLIYGITLKNHYFGNTKALFKAMSTRTNDSTHFSSHSRPIGGTWNSPKPEQSRRSMHITLACCKHTDSRRRNRTQQDKPQSHSLNSDSVVWMAETQQSGNGLELLPQPGCHVRKFSHVLANFLIAICLPMFVWSSLQLKQSLSQENNWKSSNKGTKCWLQPFFLL